MSEGGPGGQTAAASSPSSPDAGPHPVPDGADVRQQGRAGSAAAETALLSLPSAVATFWLTFWCVDIVSPGLPVMRDGLGLSDTVAGLVFSAFFAGRLIANLPAAILVDRRGARTTAAAGAGLLLVGSIATALAGGPGLLLPARVVQGTGVSLLVAAALLSTLRAQPAGGAAMTTFNVAAGIGGACGLISGGFLAGEVGWRSIFWLSALLAATMAGAALFQGRQGAPAADAAKGGSHAPGDSRASAATVAAPRRALAVALLANLLVYVNYSIFVVSLPLFADERFDASAGRIGTLLLITNVSRLIGAIPSGRAVRRWGGDRALVAGFAFSALGIGATLLAPAVFWLAVPLVLYSIGQVLSNTAAGDQVLRLGGQGGRAVGLVRFSSDVGLVVGPAAVGALADAFGVGAPFAVLAVLTALVSFAVWREGRGARAV